MRKYIYKYSYHIICMLFIIALGFVEVVRAHIKSEFGVMLINYGFWYCFGLLSGFSLAAFIYRSLRN